MTVNQEQKKLQQQGDRLYERYGRPWRRNSGEGISPLRRTGGRSLAILHLKLPTKHWPPLGEAATSSKLVSALSTEALIDTGFDGDLSLPTSLIHDGEPPEYEVHAC